MLTLQNKSSKPNAKLELNSARESNDYEYGSSTQRQLHKSRSNITLDMNVDSETSGKQRFNKIKLGTMEELQDVEEKQTANSKYASLKFRKTDDNNKENVRKDSNKLVFKNNVMSKLKLNEINNGNNGNNGINGNNGNNGNNGINGIYSERYKESNLYNNLNKNSNIVSNQNFNNPNMKKEDFGIDQKSDNLLGEFKKDDSLLNNNYNSNVFQVDQNSKIFGNSLQNQNPDNVKQNSHEDLNANQYQSSNQQPELEINDSIRNLNNELTSISNQSNSNADGLNGIPDSSTNDIPPNLHLNIMTQDNTVSLDTKDKEQQNKNNIDNMDNIDNANLQHTDNQPSSFNTSNLLMNENQLCNIPVIDKNGKRSAYVPINELSMHGIASEDMEHYRWLMTPADKEKLLLCTLERVRPWFGMPTFRLKLSDSNKFLLNSKKMMVSTTNYYHLSMYDDCFEKDKGYIGKLRSNFGGEKYVFFGPGDAPDKCKDARFLREELGGCVYEFLMGSNKSPRRIKVLLPLVYGDTRFQIKTDCDEKGVLGLYNRNNKDNLFIMRNKEPKWNEKLQAYVLNFKGRVNAPSVKNFQLCLETDVKEEVTLQFGKVTEDTFHLDFRYPFTPYQAMCTALSSFDWKMYE